VLEVSLRGPCGSGGMQASGQVAAAASGAAAACGWRRLGAVSMRRVQWARTWESGRVGHGRMWDRVPPIYDGVMCAVVDYYYLRRPKKVLINNS
jgi:hypothetical protein